MSQWQHNQILFKWFKNQWPFFFYCYKNKPVLINTMVKLRIQGVIVEVYILGVIAQVCIQGVIVEMCIVRINDMKKNVTICIKKNPKKPTVTLCCL